MNTYEKIAHLAYCALVAEVDATPKPGLVDKLDSGAHKDMDYNTFIKSANSLKAYFTQCASIGSQHSDPSCDVLTLLRPIGIQAEKDMFAATAGVNTHKGAIFSMGILCASAAMHYNTHKSFDPYEICILGGKIAAPALGDFEKLEKTGTQNPKTKGEELYTKYGIKGIRGEAASGFSSVTSFALPVLTKLLDLGTLPPNICHLQTLLTLMANVQDTNILSRSDMPTLMLVQQQALTLLENGGALTSSGIEALKQLNQDFIRLNISPGGSADLLAIAIFLDSLSREITL